VADILVWYEMHEQVDTAIHREKKIKNWKRAWKIQVIEEMNPHWRDLYDELLRLVSGLRHAPESRCHGTDTCLLTTLMRH
jgi:hypothetical protein